MGSRPRTDETNEPPPIDEKSENEHILDKVATNDAGEKLQQLVGHEVQRQVALEVQRQLEEWRPRNDEKNEPPPIDEKSVREQILDKALEEDLYGVMSICRSFTCGLWISGLITFVIQCILSVLIFKEQH